MKSIALRSIAAALIAILILNPLAAIAACQKTGEVCVDGPSTKVIAGQSVTKDCWEWQDTYSCDAETPGGANDSCKEYRDKGCGVVSRSCLETDPADGACAYYSAAYSCKVSDGESSTVTDCTNQSFCSEGKCFDTSAPPDADFAKAITMMEVARQAGNYIDTVNMTVFDGQKNRCGNRAGGNINCCADANAGGKFMSNVQLIYSVASSAYELGSSYNYDSLMDSGSTSSQNLSNTAQDASYSETIDLGKQTAIQAIAAWAAGTMGFAEMASMVMPGPWAMVIIIIQMSGVLNCQPEEQMLLMKKEVHLCHFVGSQCGPDGCAMEEIETYCCFNSVLARVINEQGRPQLGRDWGTFEQPKCEGFKVDELQKLDFSKMDLSEFFAEITPNKQFDDSSFQTNLQDKVENYYDQDNSQYDQNASHPTPQSQPPQPQP